MARKDDVLSPHHFGEALVASLLSQTDLVELPARDPCRPDVVTTLGKTLGLLGPPLRTIPNVALEPISEGLAFDGMHDVDCAIEFEDSVVAIELKLGETRLSPKAFGERFSAKVPRYTHRGTRIAGSMVAILDWNGRSAPVGQPPIVLRVLGKPVRAEWLLMLRHSTWSEWMGSPELAPALRTKRLVGVLVLEELAEAVGPDVAREAALSLAGKSIDAWFGGKRAGG